jgi:hypothetical protein
VAPHAPWFLRAQLGLDVRRARCLVAAIANFAGVTQNAVHRRHRPEIPAIIEQSCIDVRNATVNELRFVNGV